MEANISTAVQSLHLVAHVLEKQLVFVQVHLQPTSKQSQEELHPGGGNYALPNRVASHFNHTSFHEVSLKKAQGNWHTGPSLILRVVTMHWLQPRPCKFYIR